jgi:hypothetical protein
MSRIEASGLSPTPGISESLRSRASSRLGGSFYLASFQEIWFRVPGCGVSEPRQRRLLPNVRGGTRPKVPQPHCDNNADAPLYGCFFRWAGDAWKRPWSVPPQRGRGVSDPNSSGEPGHRSTLRTLLLGWPLPPKNRGGDALLLQSPSAVPPAICIAHRLPLGSGESQICLQPGSAGVSNSLRRSSRVEPLPCRGPF